MGWAARANYKPQVKCLRWYDRALACVMRAMHGAGSAW